MSKILSSHPEYRLPRIAIYFFSKCHVEVFIRFLIVLKIYDRKIGAILVDNLEINNASIVRDAKKSGENVVMLAEFKLFLNAYLSELSYSPVRSLADVIAFNNEHNIEVR